MMSLLLDFARIQVPGVPFLGLSFRSLHGGKPFVGFLPGDGNRGPPGTYYSTAGAQVVYFWHMFDQVIFRPDLLSRFHNDDLHIVDSDGVNSFLTQDGLPNQNISDHLPITFRLDI
jgi:hypothetical protein